MDIKKLILYALLALLGVSLYSAWQHDHPSVTLPAQSPASVQGTPPVGIAPSQPATDATSTHVSPTGGTSRVPQGVTAQSSKTSLSNIPAGRLIQVKTDLITASIDKKGGALVNLQLINYHKAVKDPSPMPLLSSDPNSWYVLQSGLVAAPGSEHVPAIINYTVSKTDYQLQKGENSIDVVLTGETPNKLKVTKTYHFTRNRYTVGIKYQVVNQGAKTWSGSFYSQLERRDVKLAHSMSSRAYVGASISSSAHPYKKVSYSHLQNSPLSQNIHGGWVALQQHYFLTAIIPEVYQTNHYYSQISEGGNPNGAIFTVGFAAPQMKLDAGATAESKLQSYMGPELSDRMKHVAQHLDLTIDYGWLFFVSALIFKLMKFFYELVGNWGWSIILVTLLIKLLFYPLANKSYKSMAKMKELTPRLKQLREMHANDKQALSQATMKLYKEEKVNPVGGCLPMVVQIPVFIALYYVLIESVQLRQAPFMFWIHDLSIKDPFYVLPILMGLSMFLQQRLTPQAPDPQQAKIMMFLPVIFTVFFLNFPAGLVLYWLTNNILSIAQQWFVSQQYEKKKKAYKKKR